MRSTLPALVLFPLIAAAADPVGTTTVAKWKDGKDAAFVLMYDDGCPSHGTNAIPELRKRGLTGVFYLGPGMGNYQKATWVDAAKDMAFGNHTLTHKGANDVAAAEKEITACTEALHAFGTPSTKRALISFAIPGGVPWKVTKEEMTALMGRTGMIERPPTGGHFAQINLKDGAAMIAQVDAALKDHGFGYVIFHGVGGDWLSIPMPDYVALLDAIVARRDRLWVTDTISAQQYAGERDHAKAQGQQDGAAIRVRIACDFDARGAEEPLTLATAVPAAWKRCAVAQGERTAQVDVVGGVARYDALPSGGEVKLTEAR